MKKRNLKNLQLIKKTISTFTQQKTQGGLPPDRTFTRCYLCNLD